LPGAERKRAILVACAIVKALEAARIAGDQVLRAQSLAAADAGAIVDGVVAAPDQYRHRNRPDRGSPHEPDRTTVRAMSELLLYVGNKRYSSWSLRPYLALAATGAPFRTEVIWLDVPDTAANIRTVNKAGRVPVLRHGDLLVNDSLAICEYLHELFPDAGLWPTDRATRARARSIVAEMHSSFTAMRSTWTMDLLGSRPGYGHNPETLGEAARVMEIWREARARATSGPFLFGTFTIADAFFAPVTTRFTTYGVPMDDVAKAYVATVQALPSFQAWLDDARSEPELPDHK
jgi:glutathione S-transferase